MVVNIMIGPPCSGKTTKAMEMLRKDSRLVRINRDELRRMMLGKIEVNNGFTEQLINEMTLTLVQKCMWAGVDCIIDATHCKPRYITDIKKMVPVGDVTGVRPSVTFKYIVCDIPLWKQRWRNYWRWRETGGGVDTAKAL